MELKLNNLDTKFMPEIPNLKPYEVEHGQYVRTEPEGKYRPIDIVGGDIIVLTPSLVRARLARQSFQPNGPVLRGMYSGRNSVKSINANSKNALGSALKERLEIDRETE